MDSFGDNDTEGAEAENGIDGDDVNAEDQEDASQTLAAIGLDQLLLNF